MSVMARMAGIQEGGLGDKRLIQALSIGRNNLQTLVNIANGAPPQNGVDSMYATMALNILGPALKAQKAREAGQQPPQSTVKDQVVADAQQSAPENVGIAALPQTESVMPEQAMAAGGIVAFAGGGSVEELTRQIAELRIRRRALDQQRGFAISARGGDVLQRQKDLLDEQIAQLENRFKATQARDQQYVSQRALDTAPGIPFQAPIAPAAGADQGQQPPAGAGAAGVSPSGFGGGSLAGFPAVGPSLKAAEAALKARGEFDPFASYSTFDPTQYSGLLPMTPEQIREEMGKGRTQLDAMFPEKTREEVERRLAQRYAGLEEMFKQREGRAEEAKKEAESEKGRTAGIGLMQLASELVTKPLTKIDTAAAFQTFKDANTDFRKAQKEYREGLDKIAEARELQKIGQAEKADDLFRQGALARFNFENEVTKAGILQDAVRKSGVRDIFDKKTNAQLARYDAAVKSAELGLSTALKGAELGSEERRTAMTASAYGQRASGRSAIEDKAQDNAKARVDQWMKSPQGMIAMARDTSGAVLMQMQNQFYLEELAKLQGTTAPSGGGAGPVIDFRTGKPLS